MGKHAVDAPRPGSPKPCHGPQCSQAPVVPPLAPPTVPPAAPHEWGCLVIALMDAPAGLRAFLVEQSSEHPSRHSSCIFHPPRF
jgi:hypothetical protein